MNVGKYWINEFVNAFYLVCSDINDDIIAQILIYIGFPILQQNIICLMMDYFTYQTQIDKNMKMDNLWDCFQS